MEFSKKYAIMIKLMAEGYSESNFNEEIYLMQALRATHDLADFKEICTVLGKAAGLFAVPTLMAFSVEKGSPKAVQAVLAIAEIHSRTREKNNAELRDFFEPRWWRPKWIGSKERFISYVSCIAGMAGTDVVFEGESIDVMGERLLAEIDVDLFPYGSFKEFRLCTPDWDVETDVKRVLADVAGDMLVEATIKGAEITTHPDTLYEENLINMRCDYLLTRLNLDVDYGPFRYLLKAANVLNCAE